MFQSEYELIETNAVWTENVQAQSYTTTLPSGSNFVLPASQSISFKPLHTKPYKHERAKKLEWNRKDKNGEKHKKKERKKQREKLVTYNIKEKTEIGQEWKYPGRNISFHVKRL